MQIKQTAKVSKAANVNKYLVHALKKINVSSSLGIFTNTSVQQTSFCFLA